MSEYALDPSLTEMPLHLSEVEQLLATEGKLLAKDARKVHHFTQRVMATMRLSKQQIQALHRDVGDIQLAQKRAGTATTLSPLDAVRYLTDEQLESVFGTVARQQMEFLRRQQSEAQSAARAVNADLAKIKFAVATLMEDASLPAEVRAKFDALLRRMPEQAVVHEDRTLPPHPPQAPPRAEAAPTQRPAPAPTNPNAAPGRTFTPAALPRPDAPESPLAPGAHRAMGSPQVAPRAAYRGA